MKKDKDEELEKKELKNKKTTKGKDTKSKSSKNKTTKDKEKTTKEKTSKTKETKKKATEKKNDIEKVNEKKVVEENITEENDIQYMKQQWVYNTVALFVVFGCVIAVLASSITYYFTLKNRNKKFVASTSKVESQKTNAVDSIDDIKDVLNDFAEIVDNEYIGEIDKKELVNGTIKGFISGLGDEYSEYMTAEEWEQYQEDALGNYSGVGIVMTPDDNGYILVTNVIKESPAEKAGIKQGDYIVGINGESIYEVSSTEVANKVKGEAGTEVTLNISRNNSETIDYKLTRENIRMYHVEGKMLEDNIGYVYFNTFDDGCAEEFESEMDKLTQQGAKKLVLDLRYNTGGAVDEALQIVDLFLEKGQIKIITKSANGIEFTSTSQTDQKYKFDDIVILINEYTASSSEILAGALIDNGLAKTVGTKSFGKGVMQSVFNLEDGSILKLTTQEYNTPNGTKINGVGITPDYEVKPSEDENSDVDVQLEKAKSVLKGEK